MHDIDWERLAAAIGLCVLVQLLAWGVCILLGIGEPYRQMIFTPIGIATFFGFYSSRKGESIDPSLPQRGS